MRGNGEASTGGDRGRTAARDQASGRANGPAGSAAPRPRREEILARYTAGPIDGIFTDGSCQGNPGPGGWGAVYVRDNQVVREQEGFDPATTNNRMELTAMIAGLEMAPRDKPVTIYCDSRLVVQTLTQWAAGWERRGWRRKEGEVKNLDLVREAWRLLQDRPLVTIAWIPAHNGFRWNEYADALSTAHLDNPD